MASALSPNCHIQFVCIHPDLVSDLWYHRSSISPGGAEERLGRHIPDLRRRGNRPMLSRGGATLRWSDLRNLADGAAIPGTAVFWKKDQVHASTCRSRSLPQWVCPVPRALGRPCNLRGEFIIVINLLSTRVKIFLSFFGPGELDVIHPLHRGQPPRPRSTGPI